VCGLWAPEWPYCVALLPRAFRSRSDALSASAVPCPPGVLGLNDATVDELRDVFGLDPAKIMLRVVRVRDKGQPAGELEGSVGVA
jgi:hypothetical protein